jgi:transposase
MLNTSEAAGCILPDVGESDKRGRGPLWLRDLDPCPTPGGVHQRWTEWKLGFSTGIAGAPRLRTMRARDLETLWDEVARAKKRFGLPEETSVYSCYEAGRDGFWLHRSLTAHGIHTLVVDSASIEVTRRGRRTKTDRLDAGQLLTRLIRHCTGEQKVWRVVHVPRVAEEDRRHMHRDLEEMKAERTPQSNRLKGLLASCGLAGREVGEDFPNMLEALRLWDGQAVPGELQQRRLREFARHQFVDRQFRDLENERARRIRTAEADPAIDQVRQLLELKGIGPNSAWLFVQEFFAWRQIEHRRQLGALAGLTPTPYQSGDSEREQGISKAGNRRIRTMAIEIAWCWVRYQPHRALSQWYRQRFGPGHSRLRRIGIVALARKLLVQLWRYLKTGALPAGAETISWRAKMTGRIRQGFVNGR